MHRCTMLSCSRWIVSSSLVSTKHDVWHCSNLHWAKVLCRRSRVSRHGKEIRSRPKNKLDIQWSESEAALLDSFVLTMRHLKALSGGGHQPFGPEVVEMGKSTEKSTWKPHFREMHVTSSTGSLNHYNSPTQPDMKVVYLQPSNVCLVLLKSGTARCGFACCFETHILLKGIIASAIFLDFEKWLGHK